MKVLGHKISLTLASKGGGDKRGFLLLEMIVSLILLGTAMAIIVPTLGWMGVQNRLSLQKQEAVQILHNLMEELATRPYEELTPETAEKIELPEALRSQLPGAKLEVEITEPDTQPPAKRIRMRLVWNQRSGMPLSPIRLTAWVHEKEAQP